MKKNIIYTLLLVLLVSLVLPATNTEASSKSDRQDLKDYAFLSMMAYDETFHEKDKNAEMKWIASINSNKNLTKKDKTRYKKKYELLEHYRVRQVDPPKKMVSVYAILTRDKETNEYIIAFRGTELKDKFDVATDVYLGMGGKNTSALTHVEKSVDKFKKVINEYTMSPKITFVGHSLGGALAQHATVYTINKKLAKATNVGLYTYNAPTFNSNKKENAKISNKLNVNNVKHIVLMDRKNNPRKTEYIPDFFGSIKSKYKLGANSKNSIYIDKVNGMEFTKEQMDRSSLFSKEQGFSAHKIALIYKAISM